MASDKEPVPVANVPEAQSPLSDNDAGERPVREQLKETSIKSEPTTAHEAGDTRKRSFEESREDIVDHEIEKPRKRSRECTPDAPTNTQTPTTNPTSADAEAQTVSSPSSFESPATSHTPRDPPSEDFDGNLFPSISELDFVTSELGYSIALMAGKPGYPEFVTGMCLKLVEGLGARQTKDLAMFLLDVSLDKLHAEKARRDAQSESQQSHDSDGPSSDDSGEASSDDSDDETPSESDEAPSDDSDGSSDILWLETRPCVRKSVVNLVSEDESEESDSDNLMLAKEAMDSLKHSDPATLHSGLGTLHSNLGAHIQAHDSNIENYDTNINLQDPDRSTNDAAHNAHDDESKGLNKKRSRERLEDDPENLETTSDTTKDAAPTESTNQKSTTDGEREKKRHRDNSQEPEKTADNGFATSAFGKAISASPFTSLGKTKESTDSTNKPASTSAFASSSLAAFAGSGSSPFGTLGASTPSVFNNPPTTTGFGSASTTSGFGTFGSGSASQAGTNAFAAAASKPSGLSGFASTSKIGGLTSFASTNSPSVLGETKPKPLGQTSNSDDEDESGDDNEDEPESAFTASKTDERFYEQTITTGEESESNIFTCKAKLFHYADKVWKERGIGTFKINVRDVDGKKTGRMIMRADGAGRVMLNSPIFQGMNYGDANNNPPSSKQILLVGTEEGRTVPLLLRTPSEAVSCDLYEVIKSLL